VYPPYDQERRLVGASPVSCIFIGG
jgi:hypothetical protein